MSHPLHDAINETKPLVLIGNSAEDRFPGTSYHAYTVAKRPFYCLDMGGLTESRGRLKGGRVYPTVAELPDDRGDLAVIWVKPSSAKAAVDLAHEAGCTRVWFSFHTGHADAVAHARELGIEVVEVGRCPAYYLDGAPIGCRAHAAMARLSGTLARPQQTELDKSQRVMW